MQIHDSESPFKAEKRHKKRWFVFHVEDTAWRAEALAFKCSSFASLCNMATGTTMLKFNVTSFSVKRITECGIKARSCEIWRGLQSGVPHSGMSDQLFRRLKDLIWQKEALVIGCCKG